MVASQDEEVVRILDLVAHQEADRLETPFTTVDVVAVHLSRIMIVQSVKERGDEWEYYDRAIAARPFVFDLFQYFRNIWQLIR